MSSEAVYVPPRYACDTVECVPSRPSPKYQLYDATPEGVAEARASNWHAFRSQLKVNVAGLPLEGGVAVPPDVPSANVFDSDAVC